MLTDSSSLTSISSAHASPGTTAQSAKSTGTNSARAEHTAVHEGTTNRPGLTSEALAALQASYSSEVFRKGEYSMARYLNVKHRHESIAVGVALEQDHQSETAHGQSERGRM